MYVLVHCAMVVMELCVGIGMRLIRGLGFFKGLHVRSFYKRKGD